jgi:hypothetical protein
VTSDLVGASAVALLGDGQLDALALGEGDPGLLLADDEDVALACGEGVVDGVLEVDDVEASVVALTVGDDTNTAHVATASDHGNGTRVELDEVLDLARLQVDLDRVVDLDQRVGVTDAVRVWSQYSEGIRRDIPAVEISALFSTVRRRAVPRKKCNWPCLPISPKLGPTADR